MIPVMNVPFLERTLRRLKAAGIDDVILPAGYLPEAITSYFGDGSMLGLKLRYVIEETPLGTAGALKNLERLHHRAVLRAQRRHPDEPRPRGDARAPSPHRRHRDAPSHPRRRPLGVRLRRARRGRPRDARSSRNPSAKRRRPTKSTPARTCSRKRSSTRSRPVGRSRSSAKRFPRSSRRAKRSIAYTSDDYWIDLGRPEAYLASHRHIFDGVMPLAQPEIDGPGSKEVPASAVVSPVYIGRDVRVAPSARVGPYTVLGDGCEVGAGATVSPIPSYGTAWSSKPARQIDWAIVASRVRIGAGAVVGVARSSATT